MPAVSPNIRSIVTDFILFYFFQKTVFKKIKCGSDGDILLVFVNRVSLLALVPL